MKPLETLPSGNAGWNHDANALFPVFLKAEQLRVLLVGGGKVALEKTRALLTNSPRCKLTIIALDVVDELRDTVKHAEATTIQQREIREEDFLHMHIAIAAVNNPGTNILIRQWASQHRVLLNVADVPDLCDFYLGSIVQKGHLKIAISTNGKSPTMAKRIRELLHDLLPENIHHSINQLSALRSQMRLTLDEKIKRLNELTKILIERDDSDERDVVAKN